MTARHVLASACSGVLAAALLAGCGAPAAKAAAGPARPFTASPGASAPAASGTDVLPSLDALAARGPTDAPLMRELQRVDRAAPRSADVRAERDLCVRALFAATRPVRVWFADAAGAPRGETTSGTSGTVPPRGPACARKGEALHLVVEGAADADASGTPGTAAVSARAVLFAAP